MSLKAQNFYTFGPFRLDPSERTFLRDGNPVPLPPKAFDLLVVLVERAGRLVTKDELLKGVWPGTFVEEANLPYTVSLLRKALGDDGEPYQFIETVSKRGYRFKGAVARGGQEEPAVAPPPRRQLTWLLAAVVVASLLGLAAWIATQEREPDPPSLPTRLSLVPPKGVIVENAQISPDGRRIAFVGRKDDQRMLWIQTIEALNDTNALPLAGTEGAINPFWSPDSQYIAFDVGSLKKINPSGGPPQTVYAPPDFWAGGVGGTWGSAGVIVFHAEARSPLRRVPAGGGEPTWATKLDASRKEQSHSWPHFLPDGKHFLYTVHSAEAKWSGVYVGSLDSTESKRVLDSETAAVYKPPGYLLFSRGGQIVAQRFDLTRFELKGEAMHIAHAPEYQPRVGPLQFSTSMRATIPGIGFSFLVEFFGAAIFSASDTVLAYSLFEPDQSQFEWFDRNGASLGKIYEAAPFSTFALSADGRRLVFSRARIDRMNLWVLNLERNVPAAQITFAHAIETDPRWGPDSRIGLTSSPVGSLRRLVEIDPAGRESVLVDKPAFLHDWSPDGRFLLFSGGGYGIQALPLFGDRSSIVLRRPTGTAGGGDQARFSPDGR